MDGLRYKIQHKQLNNIQIKEIQNVCQVKTIYNVRLRALENEATKQKSSEKGTDFKQTRCGVMLGTHTGLGSSDVLAKSSDEVLLGTLIDLLVELLWKMKDEQLV